MRSVSWSFIFWLASAGAVQAQPTLHNELTLITPLGEEGRWTGLQLAPSRTRFGGAQVQPAPAQDQKPITTIRFGSAENIVAGKIEAGEDEFSHWLRFTDLQAEPTPRLGKGSYLTVRLYPADPYPQVSFRLELEGFDEARWEATFGRVPFHFLAGDARGAEIFHQRGWPIGTPVVDAYILPQCEGPGRQVVSSWSRDWTYAPPIGAYPVPTVGAWTKSQRRYVGYDFHGARLKDHTEKNVASAYCWRLERKGTKGSVGERRGTKGDLGERKGTKGNLGELGNEEGKVGEFFALVWPFGSPYNELRYPTDGDVVATHFRVLYHLDLGGDDDPNLFVNEWVWQTYRDWLPDVTPLNDLSWLPASFKPRTFSPPGVPRLWYQEGERPQWWQPHAIIPGGEGWDVSGIDYAYEQRNEEALRQLQEDVDFILRYAKRETIEGDECVFWERPLEGDGADFFGPGVRTIHSVSHWMLGRALLDVYRNEREARAHLLPILDGVLRGTKHILYTRNCYPDVPAAQFAWSVGPAARFCLEYHYTFRDDPERQELAQLALKLARSMTYRYLPLWASDNDPADDLDASFMMEPNAGLEWLGAACANEVWVVAYALGETYVATGDPILGHYLRGMLERWPELFRDEYYPTIDGYGGAFTERLGLFPGARQAHGTRAGYGGLWGEFEKIAVPILDSKVRVLCGEKAALAFNLEGKHTTIADYRYARDGNFSFRLVPFPAPSRSSPPFDVTVTCPSFDLREKTVRVRRGEQWETLGMERVVRFAVRPDTLYLRGLGYGEEVRIGDLPDDAPVLACQIAKPRAPGAGTGPLDGFTLVDLTQSCNQPTKCDWSDPDSLAGFEPGRKWVYGLPFALVDPDLNQGKASVRDAEVAVNAPAERVFALVGGVTEGSTLTLTFGGGETADLPLAERVPAFQAWPPLFKWQIDLATQPTAGKTIRSVRATGCDLFALTLTEKSDGALKEPLLALAEAREKAVALRRTLAGLIGMKPLFEAFSGHVAILPTPPPSSPQTGPFVTLLRQAGLIEHVRVLRPGELVDPSVFNAQEIWVALYLGGENYLQTVNREGDVDEALVRYLKGGGTLVVVPNMPFPFYYNEKDQVVISAPKFGLPICGSGARDRLNHPPVAPPSKGGEGGVDVSGWEDPPAGRTLTFTLNPEQEIITSLPQQFPFPERGDDRWRPIVNVVDEQDRYVPIVSLKDENGRYYGDGAAFIEYRTGELAGGRVLYVWCTLTAQPDYQAGIVTDVLSYILKNTLPPPAQGVAVRAREPVLIDGRLDEPVWQQAESFPLAHCFLTKQGPPLYPTEAQVAWDEKNLYVAFVAEDPDIWSDHTARDAYLWEGEVVEVYLDPDGDLKDYKEFEVNPRCAVIDLNIPQGPDIGDVDENLKWNAPGLQASVRAEGTINQRDDIDTRWTVELALAFADLLGAEAQVPNSPISQFPKVGDTWRFQLYRIDRSNTLPGGEKKVPPELAAGGKQVHATEFSGWSATDTFHNPRRFGFLRFGANPYHDDFSLYPNGSDGSPTWTVQAGTWRVEDGVYLGQDSGTSGWQPAGARVGHDDWQDYRVSLRFQIRERGSDHRDGVWVGFRQSRAGSYSLHLNGAVAQLHKAYQGRGTNDDEMLAQVPWTPDRAWHGLAITVRGNHIRAELDGALLLEATDENFLGVPPVPSGGVVLSARRWENSQGQTVVAFDDFEVERTGGATTGAAPRR